MEFRSAAVLASASAAVAVYGGLCYMMFPFFYFLYLNPILIAAAVIPALVLLVKVYRADRREKESPGLLVNLVLRGVAATVFAMLTEWIGEFLLSSFVQEGTVLYNFLLYFIVVAVSEEGFKYLFMKSRTWRSHEFNFQFDGVVYAVFVSLGFALWENISYVLMYGFGTALIRAVTAVPGHACFGVFMGAWYGLAKKYESYGMPSQSKACRVVALLSSIVLHGCYDFTASIENQNYAWIFVVFVVAMFFVAFRLVKKLSDNDRYVGTMQW